MEGVVERGVDILTTTEGRERRRGRIVAIVLDFLDFIDEGRRVEVGLRFGERCLGGRGWVDRIGFGLRVRNVEEFWERKKESGWSRWKMKCD